MQEQIPVYIDFDVKPFLEAAEILVKADDTERALMVLDNLPGAYRDFPPPEVVELKKMIKSRIFCTQDYAVNEGDDPKPDESGVWFLENTARGSVVLSSFKSLLPLPSGHKPHPLLIDFGPGDYCMPLGLKALGERFSYCPIGLSDRDREIAKGRLEGYWAELPLWGAQSFDRSEDKGEILNPIWFIAFEIIEHLHNPWEIRYQADRLPRLPDKIFFSTPRYTYQNGNPTWRTRGIPHLRTYTPTEFYVQCNRMFPEYNFTYLDNEVMVLTGTLK